MSPRDAGGFCFIGFSPVPEHSDWCGLPYPRNPGQGSAAFGGAMLKFQP